MVESEPEIYLGSSGLQLCPEEVEVAKGKYNEWKNAGNKGTLKSYLEKHWGASLDDEKDTKSSFKNLDTSALPLIQRNSKFDTNNIENLIKNTDMSKVPLIETKRNNCHMISMTESKKNNNSEIEEIERQIKTLDLSTLPVIKSNGLNSNTKKSFLYTLEEKKNIKNKSSSSKVENIKNESLSSSKSKGIGIRLESKRIAVFHHLSKYVVGDEQEFEETLNNQKDSKELEKQLNSIVDQFDENNGKLELHPMDHHLLKSKEIEELENNKTKQIQFVNVVGMYCDLINNNKQKDSNYIGAILGISGAVEAYAKSVIEKKAKEVKLLPEQIAEEIRIDFDPTLNDALPKLMKDIEKKHQDFGVILRILSWITLFFLRKVLPNLQKDESELVLNHIEFYSGITAKQTKIEPEPEPEPKTETGTGTEKRIEVTFKEKFLGFNSAKRVIENFVDKSKEFMKKIPPIKAAKSAAEEYTKNRSREILENLKSLDKKKKQPRANHVFVFAYLLAVMIWKIIGFNPAYNDYLSHMTNIRIELSEFLAEMKY